MKITFAGPEIPETGVVVVGALEDRKLTPSADRLDKALKGVLTRAIKAGRFKGKKEQSLTLVVPGGSKLDRIQVIGLGKAEEIDALAAQTLGAQIYEALGMAAASAAVMVDAVEGCPLSAAELAAEMATGARLRAYRFDKYLTKQEEDSKPTLKGLAFRCDGAAQARAAFAVADKVADGVFFTRDLVSEPANILYPETLAQQAKKLSKLGVEVEVLDEAKMKKLGMGALLGVAQGSERPPRLVVMQWNGLGDAGKGKKGSKGKAAKGKPVPPVAFVGKGVTFDSGGISIKPSAGMEDMKWDMGGAGVVIGLMKALAGRKAKVNAVGIVGLVENMPSGTAQRPGDIVTSMSGQTIEVLNTDAEGRLVLADALWYCQERFQPKAMIDLATLTGAIIVALGHENAGLFANDDELAERLTAAGLAVDEKVWRMPLGAAYDKMLKSDAADMKNIGNRWGGSITAAQFLQRFVKDTAWAHLDIAGVTWANEAKGPVPKGGTGFGVRLLDRLVADHYEEK